MRCLALFLSLMLAACSGEPDAAAPEAPARLAELLGAADATGYERATGRRDFRFPRDHGPHAGYRNEWWYVTGNLDSAEGRRFGYELTLFRFLLDPGDGEVDSSWRTRAILVGHMAITDVDAGRFLVAERFAREAAGLAGAERSPPRVWLYDWSLRTRGGDGNRSNWQLTASRESARLELLLEPLKAPVLQGEGGLSQKSAEPGNASWYYSLPRLRTTGVVEVDGRRHEVTGLSWLDREWSTSALAGDQQGWDWFALQLDDGNELMFYQLRTTDGSRDPFSAGSFIGKDGERLALGAADVELEVLDHWDSPAGGRYPSGWRLQVPGQHLDLRIRPVMDAQELDTFVRYWEGAVDVTGTHRSQRIGGRGYVELTGYAGGNGVARPVYR